MAQRTFVSSSAKGYLDGFGEGLSLLSEAFLAERVNTGAILLGATAFVGLDKILMFEGGEESWPQSEYLKNRLDTLKGERYSDTYKGIHDSFACCLPDDFYQTEECFPVLSIQSFLADILVGLETGSSVITFGMPHDLTELRATLPPELFLPVEALLSSMQPIDASGLLPRNTIPKGKIEIFDDLFLSDFFASFTRSHNELSDQSGDQERASKSIKENALTCFNKKRRSFLIRDTTIRVMGVIPKLIDVAFGKLPGNAAETFTTWASAAMERNQNLVIYDGLPVLQNSLMSVVLRAANLPDEIRNLNAEAFFDKHKDKSQ